MSQQERKSKTTATGIRKEVAKVLMGTASITGVDNVKKAFAVCDEAIEQSLKAYADERVSAERARLVNLSDHKHRSGWDGTPCEECEEWKATKRAVLTQPCREKS